MSGKPTSKVAEQESVVSQVADAAHDAVNRVADRASDAESALRDAAEGSTEALGQKVDAAKDNLSSISNEITRYVEEKPVASAGIAFAAGVFVSLLLRR